MYTYMYIYTYTGGRLDLAAQQCRVRGVGCGAPPPRQLPPLPRPSSSRYRGYSKVRTHTAIGPYGRSVPRSIGPS